MTHASVILLGLIGQLLLPCEGIALLAEPASDCLDAVPGGTCHKFVTWALEKGIEKHPDWFPTFKRSDSEEHNFKQIQEILHSRSKAGCGKPCSTAKSLPSAEVFGLEDLEPPAADIQKTPDAEAQATPAEAPAAAVEEARPEAAPAAPAEEAQLAEAPAPAVQEAAPAAPAAEEAKPKAAPATLSEEAEPVDAPAPEAQEQSPRFNLIGTLQAEVKALEAMKDSPALKPLREEKRKLIHNLWRADKLEAELKAKHLQTVQTLEKLEAELKSLEAMDTTAALEILRSEKRAQIEKLQTADKSDTELKTREIQRLQDPAAAAKEAAPAAPAEEVSHDLAQQRPQEEEQRPPRSDLIAKLGAELKAMDQINHSPALETLRAEKRQLINNLQTADKLEAGFKARQLENVQKVNQLEADLKALEAMDDTNTPTLETLRAEKRALLEKLHAADKADAEQTTQELQRLQDPATAAKDAAPAAPAAVVDPEPQPAAADRKPWWQRRWREAKAEAVKEEQQLDETPAAAAEDAKPEDAPEVQNTTDAETQAMDEAVARWREAKAEAVKEERQPETPAAAAEDAKPKDAPEVQNTVDADAQATPAEAPVAAAEEAKPEAVPAAPAEEAKPADCLDAVPGDRCHEFVTWALGRGLVQHPDWFPLFKRSESDEQNFKQMQEILHGRSKAGCGKPC